MPQYQSMQKLLLAMTFLAFLGLAIYQLHPMQSTTKSTKPTAAPYLAPRVGRKPIIIDQQAQVSGVEGTAKNTFFSLPQVHLANPTAAQLINQKLVEYFNSVAGDTTVHTARQAVRLAEIMFRENNEQGFRGYEFQVLYNANGVLSLALAFTELSEHELVTGYHATFDLRTGNELALTDLLDTTALQRTWRQQVNESTAECVERAKDYFHGDSADLAYLKERVRWDDRSQAVTFYPGPDFTLTADGLSLFSHYDLPVPWFELQPQGEYPFTWEELRPWRKRTGPWRNLVTHRLK